MDFAGSPLTPFLPGRPLGPARPGSPGTPRSPFKPLSPWGPVGPCLPGGPSGPDLPGGLVSLGFLFFPVVQCYLLVLTSKLFHVLRRFGFAANEALFWWAVLLQRLFGPVSIVKCAGKLAFFLKYHNMCGLHDGSYHGARKNLKNKD